MIDPGIIVSRLSDQVPTLRRQVEASLDVAAMVEAPPRSAIAYVIPTGDKGGRPGSVTGTDQRISHTVMVLLGLPARNDRGAGGAVDDLVALRRTVRAALNEWQPEGWIAPLHYTGGRLVAVPKGGVWWALNFAVDSYET